MYSSTYSCIVVQESGNEVRTNKVSKTCREYYLLYFNGYISIDHV